MRLTSIIPHSYASKKTYEFALKKTTITRSSGKITENVFWNWKGILFLEYHLLGNTIQDTYEQMLKALRTTMRPKHPEVHNKDTVFLCDNAKKHTAHQIKDQLAHFNRKIFGHPTYFLDLASSDFFLFLRWKKSFGGCRFTTDSLVKSTVNSFFHDLSFSNWSCMV